MSFTLLGGGGGENLISYSSKNGGWVVLF